MTDLASINSLSDISDSMLSTLTRVKKVITRDFGKVSWEYKPFERLVSVGSCVNTQKAAPAIERWIGHNLQLTKSPKYGDFVSNLGEIIEFKYSIASAGRFRFLQLRPNQPIDATFLMGIDLSDKFRIYCFRLNRESLSREVGKGATSSHGRQQSHASSIDKEYTLTIDLDSAEFKRWCRLYRDRGLERIILKKNK